MTAATNRKEPKPSERPEVKRLQVWAGSLFVVWLRGERARLDRSKGAMDDSRRLGGDSRAGSGRPIVNTHVHLPPNFSAFDTAEQAARVAAAEGVAAIGTSNYYDFSVYRRFAAAAAEAGVVPLFGVEIMTLIDDLPG